MRITVLLYTLLGVRPFQINICMYFKRHAFAVAWLADNGWLTYDELLACHLQISPWLGGRENLSRVDRKLH